MDYQFHDGGDLTETERLTEMAGQLQRGNHKSVSKAIDRVKELLAKDVHHGFTIPLPAECAAQIKGGMIQPLGVVKQQSSMNITKQCTKFRLTRFVLLARHSKRSIDRRPGQPSTIPGNGVRLVYAARTPHGVDTTRTVARHGHIHMQVRL
jgi:hypothetical protein